MTEELFKVPTELAAVLERDYILSVMRLINERTPVPLEFVLEMDNLLSVPEGQRTEKFKHLLAQFQEKLSDPIDVNTESESVYL